MAAPATERGFRRIQRRRRAQPVRRSGAAISAGGARRDLVGPGRRGQSRPGTHLRLHPIVRHDGDVG